MIFDWRGEFSKKTLEEGRDLEDSVEDMDVGFEWFYGVVEDNFVSVNLTKDFKFESAECKCGKKRCRHMAALLYASENSFKKDAPYDYFVDKIDSQKIVKFLKNELPYHEDLLDEFKDKFRDDILKVKMYPELKLYIILEDYDFADNLIEFINNDLEASYKKDKREAFYLASSMYSELLDACDLDEIKKLEPALKKVNSMIIRLYDDIPEIITDYLKYCMDHDYDIYPSFQSLKNFYLKISKA